VRTNARHISATGDVSLFDSRCLHAGDANDSPQRRVACSSILPVLSTRTSTALVWCSSSVPYLPAPHARYFDRDCGFYFQVLFYCSFIRAEHAPVSTRGTLLDSLRGKYALEEWPEWLS